MRENDTKHSPAPFRSFPRSQGLLLTCLPWCVCLGHHGRFGVAYLLGMWLVLVLLTTAAMHWIRWTGADSLPVKKAKEDPSTMGDAEALSASGHLESIHGTPSRARARPEDDDEEAAANVRVVARGRGVREGNSMKRSEDQQQVSDQLGRTEAVSRWHKH